VKIFFAVDVETKKALAMLVTTDGTHDSRAFPKQLRKAESHGKVSKVYGDGAFDSSRVYELLEQKGIEAAIKPRRNSRLDTPSQPRRRAVARSIDQMVLLTRLPDESKRAMLRLSSAPALRETPARKSRKR